MGFKEYTISFIILSVFTGCLILFMFYGLQNNNPTSDLLTNPLFNNYKENISNQLIENQELTKQQYNATANEPPTIGSNSIILESMSGVLKTFKSSITGIFNVISLMTSQILGLPIIVLSGVITIILITVIFSLWRVYRQGS